MMRFWNVVLVTLSFGLSIFGTFLTRSGVLSSVHSFVSSPVGWWFLAFLALVVVASLVMLYRSRELLRARHDVESPLSREAVFLFNNLLLVAMALTVLWGVLFPILSASFTGERVALQAPWFEFFTVAFGLPLVLLMAVGPAVPWRRGARRAVWRRLRVPLLVSMTAGVMLIALGYGTSVAGVAAVSFGVFVILGLCSELAHAVRARRSAAEGMAMTTATRGVLVANRRRYGGYLAHAGIGLLVIAVAGSSGFDSSTSGRLERGERLQHAGWTVEYVGVERQRTANAMQTRGRFEVWRGDGNRTTLEAGRNFYPASGEVSNEVGIRHDLLRASDLMIIVDRLTEDGTARIKLVANPLVNLLWAAGVLVAAGGLVAAWPGRGRGRGALDGAHETPGVEAPAAGTGVTPSPRERVHT